MFDFLWFNLGYTNSSNQLNISTISHPTHNAPLRCLPKVYELTTQMKENELIK